ncbi:hypothetical protein MKW98_025945 [Papaver atlanticum]|uniref:Uncharacterized protein n=1 Tax=Papaver atlanticum TaxID=357466 RepID=A0AAD4SI66_9MAGN|nr:hypothetical protein MKW98_025945 [Papaver atlanticum]
MDAGGGSFGMLNKSRSRNPLQEHVVLHRKNSKENCDRFIRNRSAMDFDYAYYMLMEARKGKENPVESTPAKEAYRKQLAEALNLNRTRILAFKNKAPTPAQSLFPEISSLQQAKPAKPRRSLPQTDFREDIGRSRDN